MTNYVKRQEQLGKIPEPLSEWEEVEEMGTGKQYFRHIPCDMEAPEGICLTCGAHIPITHAELQQQIEYIDRMQTGL